MAVGCIGKASEPAQNREKPKPSAKKQTGCQLCAKGQDRKSEIGCKIRNRNQTRSEYDRSEYERIMAKKRNRVWENRISIRLAKIGIWRRFPIFAEKNSRSKSDQLDKIPVLKAEGLHRIDPIPDPMAIHQAFSKRERKFLRICRFRSSASISLSSAIFSAVAFT